MKIKLSNLDPETRKKIMDILSDKDAGVESETEDEDRPQRYTSPVNPAPDTSTDTAPASPALTGLLPLVLVFAFVILLAYSFGAWQGKAASYLRQPKPGSASSAQYNPLPSEPPPKPQPPVLQVYAPAENAKIYSPTLTITGRTEPGATVKLKTWAGENTLNVDQNGNFSYTIQLPPQPVKEITLTATNAGGSTAKTIHLDDPAAQVPESYYLVASPYGHYQNTFADLKNFLDRFHLPRGYERNVFDCSDSSAMLQWALTISGFKASIVTGPCPWDKNLGQHAWVIVHCNDYTAAVEATTLTKRGFLKELFSWSTPGLIYSNNPYAANYYGGYTKEYPDIYAAARTYGSVKEWEWWAGAWGFK